MVPKPFPPGISTFTSPTVNAQWVNYDDFNNPLNRFQKDAPGTIIHCTNMLHLPALALIITLNSYFLWRHGPLKAAVQHKYCWENMVLQENLVVLWASAWFILQHQFTVRNEAFQTFLIFPFFWAVWLKFKRFPWKDHQGSYRKVLEYTDFRSKPSASFYPYLSI